MTSAAAQAMVVIFLLLGTISSALRIGFLPFRASTHSVRQYSKQPIICAFFSSAIPAPVAILPRRRRRVIFYARYSTDEQNPKSIDDQIAKCRQFFSQLNLADYEEIILSDAEISGRRKHRPGIGEVVRLISQGVCDTVVAVDLSRYYRKVAFALDFFARAVDAGVRLMTVNDGIDTNDDRWRMQAPVMSIVAEFMVQQTAARIRGSVDNRWREGHAVNAVLPGYIRIAKNPSAEDPKHRGPYRDERDERWTPVIREAYERAARGESLWQIAKFLDERGFPKPNKAKSPSWTPPQVWRFLRQPLYYGKELHRRTHIKTIEVSGNPKKVPSAEEQILRRDMTQLAHVPEWLWHNANEATRNRAKGKMPSGASHPHMGVPRDRRGPLSTMFFCDVCEAPMHRDGGFYRCSASKKAWRAAKKDGRRCWNRCGPSVSLVHQKISAAIVDALVHRLGDFELILELVNRHVRDGDGQVAQRMAGLRKQESELKRKIERLIRQVEDGDQVGPVSLRAALRGREDEIEAVRREIAQLGFERAADVPMPTLEEVRERLEEIKPLLLDKMGRDAGSLLRQLVGCIKATPYRAFDSNRIVLRAHFSLKLVALLPDKWRDVLARRQTPEQAAELGRLSDIPMIVDLFERPLAIRHAERVAELAGHGLSRVEIAETLGVPVWLIKEAMRTWRGMQAADVTDPYILLITRPQFSARWSADGMGETPP